MSDLGSPFGSVIRRHAWAKPAIHVLLACGSIAFVFPMLWMLSTSLKPVDQTMQVPPVWIPHPVQWKNYAEAFSYIPFLKYTLNTLIVCGLGTLGAVLSNALVAYAFSRLEWPGRDLWFAFTLATMMVPFPVVMVPLYGVFRTLHWVGSLKPLWLPAWFASAFYTFMLRQFFLRIPKNLSEAMALDGASELTIFFRLYLPLAKPALAVVALFQFIGLWNDFLGPLLYLTDQDSFTLSLGLQFYQSQHGGTQWHLLMAASVMTVLPIVLLFFLTQRAYLQGITFLKNVDAN
jgi:multiple sugar transport system permease protein